MISFRINWTAAAPATCLIEHLASNECCCCCFVYRAAAAIQRLSNDNSRRLKCWECPTGLLSFVLLGLHCGHTHTHTHGKKLIRIWWNKQFVVLEWTWSPSAVAECKANQRWCYVNASRHVVNLQYQYVIYPRRYFVQRIIDFTSKWFRYYLIFKCALKWFI